MLEGSGISPFSQRGLDEAFGFAVGLRGVRLNPDVLDSELFASAGEGFGEVAATSVSHNAFDGNAEAPEVGDGGDQERDGAFLLLVAEDLSTRYPRMVVDSDVDEFPACTLTAAITCAASGDAMAHAAETVELLNVEMVARGVASRPRHALDESGTDWIGDGHETIGTVCVALQQWSSAPYPLAL